MSKGKATSTPVKVEATGVSEAQEEAVETVADTEGEKKTGTFTIKVKPSEPTSIISGNKIIHCGPGVSEVSFIIPG